MTRSLRPLRPVLAALAPLTLAAPAAAQSAGLGAGPGLEWSLLVEVESDFTVEADDPDAEINDFYPTIEAGARLPLGEIFSLNAALTFEPVKDAEDDRAFEDLGLYVDELFLEAELSAVTLAAGKIHAPFGAAWDAAPGLYGTDFAEDYELAEQLGASVAVPIAALPGAPVLEAAVFFADTTALSDSLGESRGPLDKSDGGAGNTESPENVSLTLTGGGADLNWQASLRRLAAGDGDPEDEIAAGLTLLRPGIAVGGGAELGLLGEAVFVSNAGGGTQDAVYLTAGAEATRGDWTLSGVYGLRDYEDASSDHLATATLEYALAENAAIGVGYRYGREGGEDSHTIGVALGIEFGGTW